MNATFTDPRLAALDGFRVEIDEARERADVILDRPPFNIVSPVNAEQSMVLLLAPPVRLAFSMLLSESVPRPVSVESVSVKLTSPVA